MLSKPDLRIAIRLPDIKLSVRQAVKNINE
jgi:hypothetical protein